MRIAPAVALSAEQGKQLEIWARSRRTPLRVAERAQMILRAAEGRQNREIARAVGRSRQAVTRWRRRFCAHGLAGIEEDAPRAGRKPRISADRVAAIVRKTTRETPPHATQWSTRAMARVAGVSEATVRRIWRAHGLKPHRTKTFKVSNDPVFAEKLEDIVGLSLNPPDHAVVLSVDEKSPIQALDRTQPGLPLKKGRLQTMTHDYQRHGTSTLFAALSTLEGNVIGTCMPRHTHREWWRFLQQLDRETPAPKPLHVIADNYGTHKPPRVIRWRKRHPRFHMHFTPTGASWLNMIERFFRDLSTNRIRRGSFASVPELLAAIETYIAQHNREPKPFIWTAKTSDILEKVKRAREKLNKLQSV